MSIDRNIVASEEFLQSLQKLSPFIYLSDPALAGLFAKVRMGKFGFSLLLSSFFISEIESSQFNEIPATAEEENKEIMVFEAIPIENTVFSRIHFTMPTDELMELDLNEHYEWLSRGESKYSGLFEDIKQYYGDILKAITDGKAIEDYVGYEEKEKLIELYPKLKAHQEILVQARTSLQEFIRKQFSLEDLLSVTK